MTAFETVYGVDFAVAKRDADRKVWVAEGDAAGEGLEITRLQCARDFFASGSGAGDGPRGRDETLEALQEAIAGSDGVAWGLDFPFSVPAGLVADDAGWEAVVTDTEATLHLTANSPDGLFDRAKSAVDGDGGLYARAVDEQHEAQPAAGWFMKYLTYHGIRGVLGPLAMRSGVAVVPYQDAVEAETVVMEVYPAGTLFDIHAPTDGYKGVTDENLDRREEILTDLGGKGVSFESDRLAERAAHNDDALDAVVAALATWRNTDDREFSDPDYRGPEIEGHIYV